MQNEVSLYFMCNDTSIYFSSSLYLSISSIVVHKTIERLMKENVVVLFLKFVKHLATEFEHEAKG